MTAWLGGKFVGPFIFTGFSYNEFCILSLAATDPSRPLGSEGRAVSRSASRRPESTPPS
jgi:hypothetical protein